MIKESAKNLVGILKTWATLTLRLAPKLGFPQSQKNMKIEGEGESSPVNKEIVLENVIRQMVPITARLPAA